MGGLFFSYNIQTRAQAALEALDDALKITVVDAALCGNDMVYSVAKQMAALVEQARVCKLL